MRGEQIVIIFKHKVKRSSQEARDKWSSITTEL